MKRSLPIYFDPEEKRRLRLLSLNLALSASQFVRLAALVIARQCEELLRQGMPPTRIVEALMEQAEGARNP